jgi:ribonuclease HI
VVTSRDAAGYCRLSGPYHEGMSQLVTVSQFDASVDLLAPELRDRALQLRPLVWAGERLDVVEAVALAFDAAYAGDQDAARSMIEQAEACLATGSTRPPGPPAGIPTAHSLAKRGVHGHITGGDVRGGPCLVATDASVKKRHNVIHAGWGYVAATGHWGFGGGAFAGELDPTGPSAAIVAELRAVYMALTGLSEQVELACLVDSQAAVSHLRRWQAGHVNDMPAGYSLRPRFGAARTSAKPTLVQLAELVAGRTGLTFGHVSGHAGHPLNEAADGLASLARRCVAGEQTGDAETLDIRARALVTAFLAAWQDYRGT